MRHPTSSQTVRRLLAILVALSALLAWPQDDATPAPTPEQRFFDWTDLPFPKEVYAQRRGRLIHALRESAGGIYLAPARNGRSHGETFRQNNDFLYFTGLELPSAILAVDADRRRTTLFVPERDARFASVGRANDFPGRPLGDDPELRRRSGIPEIRPFRQFAQALAGWIEAQRPAPSSAITSASTSATRASSSSPSKPAWCSPSSPGTTTTTAASRSSSKTTFWSPPRAAKA